jgi:cytochrome c2
MENIIDKIDRYIQNEMTAAEKAEFENELNANADLKDQYLNQLNIVKGIRRSKLEEIVKTSVKRIKTVKKLVKAGVIISAITLVAAGVYFVGEKFSKAKENNIRYELNEEGNKNWAVADKVLEAQVFKINPTKDTVIETKGGIIFSIPANIFLNQFGESEKENVEIEIKEALTAYDIIKAGLSTTSNGNLLETGGMFYFNARNSKANLDIDKRYEVGVAVPYAGKKEMMLFDGERKSDGSINWINPKPTKKQLTTVDILSLNFYPPNYLDSLSKLGYNSRDKAFTDSLYYSFICNSDASLVIPEETPNFLKYENGTVTKSRANVSPTSTSISSGLDGKGLFKQNCSVCHSMTDEKFTGPGLAGIESRVPGGNWLFEYIKNNEKLIKAGDPYANKIYKEYGNAAMTVFEGTLSDDDIRAIIEYLSSPRDGL